MPHMNENKGMKETLANLSNSLQQEISKKFHFVATRIIKMLCVIIFHAG